MTYNKTQLNPDTAFERHIFHRDQFAHYLRWSHVMKIADMGMNILDFGCGSGNLYELFYRNRYSPARYLGLDVRGQTIENNKEKFPKAEFQVADLCGDFDYGDNWDIITSFEVIEHIGKQNGDKFLANIAKHCNSNTTVLISTPCYNEKVGAADNHIIDGQIGEYTYQELKEKLEKFFIIESNYGTFASIKDYKQYLNPWQLEMFNKLSEYYDTNLLSVMMAPFFPEHSRNVLWKLRKK